MTRKTDISGRRFGRWTVLSRAYPLKNRQSQWLCRCDCGTQALVMRRGLMRGTSQSCGCLRNEMAALRVFEHGLTHHKLFNVWKNMMSRCYRRTDTAFSRYGGRGIKVCQRWHDIRLFVADNEHLALPGLTLDRRNNDGDYTPDNTRWATRTTQALNRRSNVRITYAGKTQTIFEWAREIGIRPRTLWYRIQVQKWSIERAITIPVSSRLRNRNVI